MVGLAKFSLARPMLAAAVLLALTVGLGSGLPRLHPEYGYRPLLGGSHPSIETLEEFIETFGGGFPLLVVWSCGDDAPCETVFDEASVRMAAALERDLLQLPHVMRVSGPATTPLLVPDDGGYSLRRFFENGRRVEDAASLIERVKGNSLWERRLVSANGQVGAIVVELANSRSSTMSEVVEGVTALLSGYEAQGYRFNLAGHPIEAVVAGQDLERSSFTVTPITITIIALVLLALTRSAWVVVASMFTISLAVVWTFGLLGWIGWSTDSILQVLPILILTIGACDAMHLVARAAANSEASKSKDRREAILLAAREVARPCFLTTLTTAAAFLSFLASDLATFRHCGILLVVGVWICFVLTFSLLPLLLHYMPADLKSAPSVEELWRSVFDSIASLAQRRAHLIVGSAAVLLLVFGYGWLAKLSVDTDINEMYGSQNQVTRWIRFVDENLGGLDSLEADRKFKLRFPWVR